MKVFCFALVSVVQIFFSALSAATEPGETLFQAGKYSFDRQDYSAAGQTLQQIEPKDLDNQWWAKAQSLLAEIAFREEKFQNVIEILGPWLRRFPNEPDSGRAMELLGKSLADNCSGTRIGFIGPLTGDYADYGRRVLQGALLAIDEYNTAAGETIVLVPVDSHGDPEKAEEALNELLKSFEPVAVIGPVLSSEAKKIIEPACKAKVPIISPTASADELSGACPYFFRNCLTPKAEAVAAADYAYNEKKLKKFGIIYPNTPYGNNLADAFITRITELGGQTIASQSYEENSTDFKDIILAFGGIDPGTIKDMETKEQKELKSLAIDSAEKLSGQISGTPENPSRVAIVEFKSAGMPVLKIGDRFSAELSYALAHYREIDVIERAKLKEIPETVSALTDENAGETLAEKIKEAVQANFLICGEATYVEEAAQGETADRAVVAPEDNFYRFKINFYVRNLQTMQKTEIELSYTKTRPPKPNPLGLDALYLPGRWQEMVMLVPQLFFYDLRLPCIGSSGWQDKSLIKLGGDALDGTFFTSEFFPGTGGECGEKFMENFIKCYAYEPDGLSALGYDAAEILSGIYGAGSRTRKSIKDSLDDLKNFSGVSGRTSFEHGEINKQVFIIGIHQGQFVTEPGSVR